MSEIKVKQKFIREENIRTDESALSAMAVEHRGPFAILDDVGYECIGVSQHPFVEVVSAFQNPEMYIEGIYPYRHVLIQFGDVKVMDGFLGVYGLSTYLIHGGAR